MSFWGGGFFMYKRFGWIVFLLIAAVVIGMIPGQLTMDVPTLSYTQPSNEVLRQQINCSGTVMAAREAELYLGCAVIPKEVNCQVGDWVGQGQQLARLDLEMTQAVMAQSQQISMEALPVSSSQMVQALQGQLSGSVTGLEKQLEQYIQSLTQQQDRVLYLQEEMAAPFSGIITQVALQTDKLSQSGEPAFVLTDPESYYILSQVPQNKVSEIAVDNTVQITLPGSGSIAQGVVAKIHPTATASLIGGEPTIGVEIAVTEGREQLKGGYAVTLRVETTTPREALTLPYEAVDQDDQGEYIYCVQQDGTIEKRRITSGRQALGRLEIVEGATAEDVVLLNPQLVDPQRPLVILKEAAGNV